MTAADHTAYQEAWRRHHGGDPGAGRARALDAFLALGFPGRQAEDWRYTDLTPVRERSLAWLAQGGAPQSRPPLPDWRGPRLDLVDGTLVTPLGAGPAAAPTWPAGLAIRALAADEADLPGDHGADANPVQAYNRAWLGAALAIETTPGARLADALRVGLVSSGARQPGHARLRVTLAPASSLDLVVHQAPGPSALATLVTDVRVGPGARLRLIRFQEAGDDALLLEQTRIHLEADASAEVITLDLGGRLVRHDLAVGLEGTGATASVAGLFLADGNRHIDNHTRLDHRGPRTNSQEVFRGVLDDSGRGVFNGKVIVHPGAAGSQAALTNRNLLLSKSAEVDTKPELEISVDDVRCSHGATTGQLDPAALFYLQSRGLAREEARRILVLAFAGAMLEQIPIPVLREYATGILDRRLGANPAGARRGVGP